MYVKELRDAIREFYPEAVFFGADPEDGQVSFGSDYDNSIVGVTETGSVVYEYNSMVQEYMKDNNSSEEEAIYNTVRSLDYFNLESGEKPTILYTDAVDMYKYDKENS